jgi:hypothetical protein
VEGGIRDQGDGGVGGCAWGRHDGRLGPVFSRGDAERWGGEELEKLEVWTKFQPQRPWTSGARLGPPIPVRVSKDVFCTELPRQSISSEFRGNMDN